MTKKIISAACVQIQPEFGATAGNVEKIVNLIEQNASGLIVFPELATSGYEFRSRDEAFDLAFDPRNSDIGSQLRQVAATSGSHVVVGFPERSGEKIYNSAALFCPDDDVHVYRKIHLFDREKNIFSTGDAEPEVIDTAIGKIGIMICFDWVFPEVARILALKGAEVICHPSNLVLAYCQRAMFARSVENGVFTMTCNRIGSESRIDRTLTFTGRSQILGNRGELLAQASEFDEKVIHAELDLSLATSKRMTDLNDLWEDRRINLYGELLKK